MSEQSNDWALSIEDLTFSYPCTSGGDTPEVLHNASLRVKRGAFVLLVGGTGSGKTTLLRLCKPEIAPVGKRSGSIQVCGREVGGLSPRESASLVSYVFQSPESQVVCDSVWHEMAFGMENLGVPEVEMRRRMAETCYFFGMEPWLRMRTSELSGGRLQLLALASVLTMRPRVLLLDEPTSMLDPVAEGSFISMLYRINRELGVTVVVATHRPKAMVEYATNAYRLENGEIQQAPLESLRVEPPLIEGSAVSHAKRKTSPQARDTSAVLFRNVWFRYDRNASWVFRDTGLSVLEHEVRVVVGGNGSGKSTLLSLVAGLLRPQRGSMTNELGQSQAFLPQNPKALLGQQSVREELMEWSSAGNYRLSDAAGLLMRLGFGAGRSRRCSPDGAPEDSLGVGVLERHPYDLSGGEQQLLALTKLLLVHPKLLLLDEPTKGLDHHARSLMAQALLDARNAGTTIVMATHDLAFAHEVADSVSLLFGGEVTLTQPCEDFFCDSWVWRA